MPQFGCLHDEAVQPVFDPDEDPGRSGPRRLGQEFGWPVIEVIVQAQGRPPAERGDQIPDLVKHETFRVEVLDLRAGRPMLIQDAPDGGHMITVFAAGGSSTDIRQKQHDRGGNHAILDLGQSTRVLALLSPLHVRFQELQGQTLMVDLPEVDRAVRLLCMEMQAGKAQNRMQQPLVVGFHGHAQHDFLKRVGNVVMNGQDLAQMVGKMVQEPTVHVGFDAGSDVSWGSAQAMRNDRVCLVLARKLMGEDSTDGVRLVGYLISHFRFPGEKTSWAGIRHRHSHFGCSCRLSTHQPSAPSIPPEPVRGRPAPSRRPFSSLTLGFGLVAFFLPLPTGVAAGLDAQVPLDRLPRRRILHLSWPTGPFLLGLSLARQHGFGDHVHVLRLVAGFNGLHGGVGGA